MSISDPVSDFINVVRSGNQAHKETVDVPASRLLGKVLDIFKNEGYIEDYKLMKTHAQGTYKIYLKYQGRKPVIMGLRRISKPGLRIYKQRKELPRVLSGLGTAVISTSKGVMSDKEARKANIGGEILCYIW